ncbi:DUF993 family protein [bacterium]|nr:DUF993 family protein [bacterium]
MEIKLPSASGAWYAYEIPHQQVFQKYNGPFSRVAFAAAHVVPMHNGSQINWEATMAYRRHLWSYGLGVAEAMDTAQRGMGLDFNSARELIKKAIDEAKSFEGALLASGCGTDQLKADKIYSINEIINAYEDQIAYVESLGGKVILMASRALAASAKSADDYEKVYDKILTQVREPVIIHWLGEMFDPALKGYWGSENHYEAMEIVNRIITKHVHKVDGIKVSLLDKDKEVLLRKMLPDGVKMYTGDDFNYPELIAGQEGKYSHALLGIFDAIAPAASAALHQLSLGNEKAYFDIFNPTVALSRHIFSEPTRYYKTGLVFLAWLNGFQNDFIMLGQQQTARSTLHLVETFKLACQANVLVNPELALQRMQHFLNG